MDSPKLIPPGTNFLVNNYFTTKYGLSLKNFPQMKERRPPEHISLAKLERMAYPGGFRGLWKLLRPVSSAARNVLYSHSQPHATLSFRAYIVQHL